MKKIHAFLIAEIFVIALIPALAIMYDFIEDSDTYDKIFNFDSIENSITYRFSGDYGAISPTKTTPQKILVNGEHEPDFTQIWKLIQKHSLSEFPEKSPTMIFRPAVENSSYVSLPSGEYYLIPDSIPIVALYCNDVEKLPESCDSHILVGTLNDVKDWLRQERQEVRNQINLVIGIVAIGLAVLIWNEDRQKSFLLLKG